MCCSNCCNTINWKRRTVPRSEIEDECKTDAGYKRHMTDLEEWEALHTGGGAAEAGDDLDQGPARKRLKKGSRRVQLG